jgi:hypothetical protein
MKQKLQEIELALAKHDRNLTASAEGCSKQAKDIADTLARLNFRDEVEVYDTENMYAGNEVLDCVSVGMRWDGERLLLLGQTDQDVVENPYLGVSREDRIKYRYLLEMLLDRILEIIEHKAQFIENAY